MMNRNDIVYFLKNFDLKECDISEFLANKKVCENEFGVFIREVDFNQSEVYGDDMLFVKLSKTLPTTYFLEWISRKGNNLNIKSEKKALDFTYSKNLSKDLVKFDCDLVDGRYYVIMYDGSVLGYARFDLRKKLLINLMNVGEYLREV